MKLALLPAVVHGVCLALSANPKIHLAWPCGQGCAYIQRNRHRALSAPPVTKIQRKTDTWVEGEEKKKKNVVMTSESELMAD